MNCRLIFHSIFAWTLLWLCGGIGCPLEAHPVSQSYWRLDVESSGIRSRLIVPLDSVALLRRDEKDGKGTFKETVLAKQRELEAILIESFKIISRLEEGHAQVLGSLLLPSGYFQADIFFGFQQPVSDLRLISSFQKHLLHPHQTLCRLKAGDFEKEFLLSSPTAVYDVELPVADAGRGSLPGHIGRLFRGVSPLFGPGLPVLVVLVMLTLSQRIAVQFFNFGLFLLGQIAGVLLVLVWSPAYPRHFIDIAVALTVCYVAIESLIARNLSVRFFAAPVTGFFCGSLLASSPMFAFRAETIGQSELGVQVLGIALGQTSLVSLSAAVEAACHISKRPRVRWPVAGLGFGLGVVFLVSVLLTLHR